MGKSVHDDVLDAALDEIINNADLIVMCAGEPSTYADATTLVSGGGNKLGDETVSPGDFTKADGDVSGRKVTVAAKTVTADEAGTVDHIALVDNTGSRLLHVTTADSFAVSGSTSYELNAYDEEIEDPT